MSVINETHEGPALWASRGYEFVALVAPDTAPSPTIEGRSQQRGIGRKQARQEAKRRKAEVARGVPFLRTLTTTRQSGGAGAWSGEAAPSRLPGKIT